MNTVLTAHGNLFYINGKLTYSELPLSAPSCHGMLMNSRMIQGVFDDAHDPRRFDRFGKVFCPEANTQNLIDALPAWFQYGLRAITVGFQGGGPCFTTDNYTVDNNPFSADGLTMDTAYLSRMQRIIEAADKIGMVVIVSYFYGAHTRFLQDDIAIMNAVKTASNFLRDNHFTNVIIEIANEHDISCFRRHPILYTGTGVAVLLDIARRESGGMLVGCSGYGGQFDDDIATASDVVLIHTNDQSRQRLYNLVQRAKANTQGKKPIVINEDSQALSNMAAAVREGVSWGYYNNMTKQEPPADFSITEGEDRFFALRMQELLGIAKADLPLEEQFHLQGLASLDTDQGMRWIRLASLYPETIDYVEFVHNDRKVGAAYDDPYMLNSVGSNWLQKSYPDAIHSGDVFKALVHLVDGRVVTKTATV